MTTVIDWDAPHGVIASVHRRPWPGEEIVLELRGQEVPRAAYRLLEDTETGELVIWKPDATWGDCCSCTIWFREKQS